jgi:uracil-DNA glycosylase
MSAAIPPSIIDQLDLAHASWRPVLKAGLEAVAAADPDYLPALAEDAYLPTGGRLFAAFVQPLQDVRYVLVGEGPYPRPESATGVCFMDGAVDALWSDKGLSKQVNRATSLRNFMKMLLVTAGQLSADQTSGDAMVEIAGLAHAPGSRFIQTRAELQENLVAHGFLLLNATLVFRPQVPPIKDARAWRPFIETVLEALADHAAEARRAPPVLILWGKVAELLSALPAYEQLPKVISEHPYNLTFITNSAMQELFGPMKLLLKR